MVLSGCASKVDITHDLVVHDTNPLLTAKLEILKTEKNRTFLFLTYTFLIIIDKTQSRHHHQLEHSYVN